MKNRKTQLILATGAAFAATAALSPALAADNPFGMQKLSSRYQLASRPSDAPCRKTVSLATPVPLVAGSFVKSHWFAAGATPVSQRSV